jgi:antitoxin (DNA-binding transcriptional repressor) of toxin-antitoxin stability system
MQKESAFTPFSLLRSYVIIKHVRIAELKARLSEYLFAVQAGKSYTVLDRNTAIAQIVTSGERLGVRVRKPASGAPAPIKVPLPKPAQLKIDVLELLLEERQGRQ